VLACALVFVSSFAPAMARAAGDGLSAATWHVPEPDPLDFTGADEAGFWTAGGERIGLDGKRDLKLRVPPGPPNEVDNAATVPGPKGPVFAEGIRDGARRGHQHGVVRIGIEIQLAFEIAAPGHGAVA
jgi:hypothetical protein